MPLFTISEVMGEPQIYFKPKDIVNYMVSLQRKCYNDVIDLTHPTLVRNIKLLLKKYTPEEVCWGIWRAAHVSDYPYSTKLVEEILIDKKVQEENSPINMYIIL